MSPRAWPLILLTSAVLVAGCSSSGAKLAVQTPSPTVSATPSPTASPTPRPTGDPLTGLAPGRGPVVVIKVDNAFLARPYQRGLKQAAIVYQELVEGGSTRFMAVFESGRATSEVGPIRSARESDIDILRAYGRPALAFSGAQPKVLAIVRAAAHAGYVIDASYDSAPSLYRLGEHRRDARNFFAVPAKLGQRLGGAVPRDIGLRFGPVGPGTAISAAAAAFSTLSVVKVRYVPARGTYVMTQGGRAIPFNPSNIVIQYVTTHPSRFHDVHGMNTPLTVSTGSGTVVVLRDGKRFIGHWRRSGYGPTRLLDAAGHDLLLKPGQTWVMLMPRSGRVTYS